MAAGSNLHAHDIPRVRNRLEVRAEPRQLDGRITCWAHNLLGPEPDSKVISAWIVAIQAHLLGSELGFRLCSTSETSGTRLLDGWVPPS